MLFLSLSLIWGLPYLFIKVAVADLNPVVIVWGRVALAALVLLPIALARGMVKQLRPYVWWILAFAVIEIGIPFLMLGWAETRISSSLAALLVAAVPIIAAVLALILGLDDRLSGIRVVGLFVGIVGVACLVGLDVTGGQWLAVGAMLIVALGYATGPIIVATKLSAAPSLGVIAVALSLNALWYAPLAWIARPSTHVPAHAWGAVAVLGLVCTALAFLVFFSLIAEVGPARTTVITYLNPAVALILGVIVLNEPITLGLVIGFPLVLLGSYLATRKSPQEAQPEPA